MEPVEIDIRLKQNVDTESEKAVQGVNNISTAAKDAVQSAKAAVQEQESVIKQIESDLDAIAQKMNKTASSTAKSQLLDELTATKQALAEEKAALSDYKTKLDEVAQSSTAFGSSVNAAGGKIGESFDSISSSGKAALQAARSAVQEQVELIKSIENDVKSIQKQVDNAAPGNSKEQLTLELQSAKQALEEEKAALTGYKAKVDEASQANASLATRIQSIVSEMTAMEAAGGKDSAAYDTLKQKAVELITEQDRLKQTYTTLKQSIDENNGSVEVASEKQARLRTQVMNAKDELSKMEMAGKRGTPEYEAQAQALGKLADQMSDTTTQTRILADDQRGFKAVSTAVTGLTGAFSAGMGVAALFAGENEDLVKIQTRLQAVMAITIGIQQVSETLNKDSYFSVVLLTRAKTLWAAANLRVAATLGISTAAAKGMMLVLTGGLIIAITAAVAAVSIMIDRHQEAAKAAEEAAKTQQEAAQKTADDYGKEIAKVGAMRASLDSENISRKQKLSIISQLKELIPGYTATLDKEGNVIRENKKAIDDYMVSIDKSMRLRASEDKLSKLYSKAYSIESSPEFQRQKEIELGASKVVNQIRASKGQAPVEAFKVTTPELDKIYAEIDNAKKYISSNNLVEFVKPDKQKKEKATKEVYDAEKELQKLILDINAETSTLRLDQQADSLQKRLSAIDLEKQEEIRKITEKETAIVEAYNKNHKDDKGFVALSTDASTLSTSVSKIDPTKGKELATATTNVTAAYDAKQVEETRRYGEEITKLAQQFADERVQIMHDYNADIVKLVQAGELEAAGLATIARDKQVSDVTFGLIQETKAYKIATDEKYNIGKELNEKLVVQIKERVAAELAAGKLTKKDAKEILDTVERSQAPKVSGSLGDLIDSYGKLKKAKEDLSKAKEKGDLPGAEKATESIEKYTVAVDTTLNKIQSGFATAQFYAGQAMSMLDAMSTEEGDAASSASKSIGAVMNIANSTMEGFKQGGYVGAGIALVTSTLSTIFNAEKAHQQALAAIAKAKADTQKEYNDLLMKQNDLLEKAQNIFGTSKLTEANAYVAQIAAYGKAKDDAVKSLSSATVQTGSHKTGLFGWGGEKADYSGLLKTYPLLINSQGELNTELATSILANEKLNDSSKSALQSALDYTEEYKSALDSLKSYLSGIFGSLSDDLMTVIFDNLDNSKSAVDDFQDYVGNAMKKMISDLAQQIFFAQMFSDLSDKVLAVYKDTSLSNEAKTAQVTSAVGAFYNGIGQATSDATKFINDMYGSIKTTTGIDISASTETARTGTTKGIATASQDSVDENNANLYALRMIGADSRNYVREQLLILRTMSSQLDRIADNTEYCKLLENIKQYLEDMNIKGIKVKV